MFSPFQNCWDRVDRAEVHRQSLINRWNAFDTTQAYASRPEVDSDGTGRFFLEPVKRDWVLPFSLELGEMLYQLRSALDSCVYDAAALKFGSDPPPNAQQWQLPITSDPADFKEAIRRMKDIPPDIAAIIERVQGYSGLACRFDGKQFDLGTMLVALNNWARIDRHRKLHLVGTALTGGSLVIGYPIEMGIEYCHFVGSDILENQSEIARFKISNFVPGATLHFQPKFALEIMVDEVPRARLQEMALGMGIGVSAVREMFENHFGITR
jgi:hypothetical protein